MTALENLLDQAFAALKKYKELMEAQVGGILNKGKCKPYSPQEHDGLAAWCEQAAARQLEAHFASHGGDARDQDLKALAGVYGPEWADAVLSSTAAKKGERVIGDTEGEGAEEGGGPCGHCGQPAAKRCGQCQKAWYCGRDCQVAAWKRHRRACRPAL